MQTQGCVESCMNATVRECTCGCGGKNHAIHSIERLDVFEDEDRHDFELEANDE